MPKIEPHVKERISELSKKDLEKLVLKAATMNKQFYDFFKMNYLDKDLGVDDLYDQVVADLNFLMIKSYKGYSYELKSANMFAALNKRVGEFDKVCKDKTKVMDLYLILLKEAFSNEDRHFGTCFTQFNYRIYLMLKKAITLLQTKLHEDYHIQYAPTLNKYLTRLHQNSNHLDYVYHMPQSV